VYFLILIKQHHKRIGQRGQELLTKQLAISNAKIRRAPLSQLPALYQEFNELKADLAKLSQVKEAKSDLPKIEGPHPRTKPGIKGKRK